jgi:hypothetical protein
MQHGKKQSQQAHFTRLLYQKVVPSRCDHGGIASSQSDHGKTIILLMVGHFNWPDICMVVESSSGAACMQRGYGTIKVVPYLPYKKISDVAQISEQPMDI